MRRRGASRIGRRRRHIVHGGRRAARCCLEARTVFDGGRQCVALRAELLLTLRRRGTDVGRTSFHRCCTSFPLFDQLQCSSNLIPRII